MISDKGMSSYFDLVRASLQTGDFGQLASLLTAPGGKKLPNPAINDLVQLMQFVRLPSKICSLTG